MMKTIFAPKTTYASLTSLRVFAIAGAIAFSLGALTGCSASSGAASETGMTHDMGLHDMAKPEIPVTVTPETNNAAFSSADIMFAQMMIPHHQQAVEMGTLAETRAFSPVVGALAAQIKNEQAPEISQMKAWLKTAGASMNMGHDMGMNGMLDSTSLKALRASKGKVFDDLFLKGMIGHHLGAVDMAKTVLDSKNPMVQKLAQQIIGSQTQQINFMKTVLKN
ncbi:MAG: hypothetical protein RLZ28_423 [Actinomycetota bacterium]|jgi:uncharacterized protein (DUF305 family)